MSLWQDVQTIAFNLKLATWPDGTQGPVFDAGSVRTSGAITKEAFGTLISPMAFVYPAEGPSDPELRGLVASTVRIRLTVVAEDELGEVCLIGGMRTGGQGTSDGKGLLEIEEAMNAQIDRLNRTTGMTLTGGLASAPTPTYQSGIGYIITREYAFDCPSVRARYYPAPLCLVGTSPGGGSTVLTWVAPAPRFDFHPTYGWEAARGGLIIRRLAGPVAPTTPAQGTAVALSDPFAETVTDSPGAGTHSYAIWATFDELGSGSYDRTSDLEPGTTKTVVVT